MKTKSKSNETKEVNTVKCGYCPATTTSNKLSGGEFYKGVWFCSHSCVDNYREEESWND